MADVGRPLKFESVKALQQKIEAYFESCYEEVWREIEHEDGTVEWKRKYDHKGEPLTRQVKPYTLSGLAVFLECDRKTLLNYSNREEYFPTIKAAKTKVESYVEEQLLSGSPAAGPIFNLKNNFDEWKDKQEVDQNIAGKDGGALQVTFSPGMKKNE